MQLANAEISAWSAGLGVEGRLQKEVNPDFVEGRTVGMLFGQILFSRWGIHSELSVEDHTSNSGAMTIAAKTYSAGVWGRYIFINPFRWQPYVSLGLGANFDTITSRFGAVTDERSGRRYFAGTGFGISAIFWKHLLTEAEGKVVGVQDRKEPMISALFRIGFIY